ncbi:Palmitoyl-acyl carrier protein thioesterase, chloroplastic [Castilleja foliolosa]|uniref:Acyl-[acyl-carrier-protein] hydrolase n=1 Tax=Castilleja foliolosa TaxID=1961234 RepID=A0ABD3ECB3_9LAMI
MLIFNKHDSNVVKAKPRKEIALNHVRNVGLLADGFGSTPEMCKQNFIWVVPKMQVLVDRYPTWGDVVQVDTWVAAYGKNGMRRDWLVRERNTGDILTRASRSWVVGNKDQNVCALVYIVHPGFVKALQALKIRLHGRMHSRFCR